MSKLNILQMTKAEVAPTVWMTLSVCLFGGAEFIIGVYEYVQHSFNSFDFAEEAAALATEACDIMAQVRV